MNASFPLFLQAALLLGSTSAGSDNALTAAEKNTGWLLLFDGKSLDGWMTSGGKPGRTPVEDGSINPHRCGDYMMVYEKPFSDFILALDFKIAKGCNSGIFVRTSSLTARPGKDVGFNGIEVAIDDTTAAAYTDTGAIYDLAKPSRNAMKPAGDWNHVVITCDGSVISVALNGEAVTRADLSRFTELNKRPDGTSHKFDVVYRDHSRLGYIGLQDHGAPCWFKNIKLKRLAAGEPSLKAHIDRLAGRYIGSRKSAALALGVLQGARRHFKGFGAGGPGGKPPDERTIFEIGSVTKVFTGALLAKLEAGGLVSLDDGLEKHLPRKVSMSPRVGRITLKQLATHTSGLPRLPDNLGGTLRALVNPYADYKAGDLYEALAKVNLPDAPVETPEYSNLGVGLLGHILSLRTGKPYEALVKQMICAPLAMTDTVITLSASQRGRLARGHVPDGRPAPGWDFDVLAPAGALRSTSADLLKFLDGNLPGRESPLAKVLARAREAHFRERGGSIGLCWHIIEEDDGRMLHWHNGGTGGYVSFLGLDSGRRLGVVLLSSSGDATVGDDSLDEMGLEILKAAGERELE